MVLLFISKEVNSIMRFLNISFKLNDGLSYFGIYRRHYFLQNHSERMQMEYSNCEAFDKGKYYFILFMQ